MRLRRSILPLFTEQTAYAPSSPYSASKASSDHLVRAWLRTYGLPTMVTNCSNNYGPYHFPEKLIPLVILNALEGKSLPIYGKGDQIRDWLYVEDHARALYTVVTKGIPGETYNIGGHNEKKISMLYIPSATCWMRSYLKQCHTVNKSPMLPIVQAMTVDTRSMRIKSAVSSVGNRKRRSKWDSQNG